MTNGAPPDSGDRNSEAHQSVFARELHGRERWWREDELVNQRITWLLTMQAVIGTAYGFVRYRIAEIMYWNLQKGPPDVDAVRYLDVLRLFAVCLVTIGIVGSVVSFAGICAAHHAQRTLQQQYSDTALEVSSLTTGLGHLTALATPLLFICAWLAAAFLFRQPCECEKVTHAPPYDTSSSDCAIQKRHLPQPRGIFAMPAGSERNPASTFSYSGRLFA
jgi:hypothetical protein